ncbi:protein-L-isoaspartate(D-aspartate) O-methyltransferase [Phytoactinopolyspora endophytica]|uniref:protein-L-isoaspartate(D-aspartate) O-methyltransferase n=1 Tax=Phytoactinopolyspora endophytica TaxID=1642495 RepID=UPI00101CA8F4|nr:protein-L-isoaspartate(D-aspartate) O-methyltransferase [Phytoactinopolyspora endophytica]
MSTPDHLADLVRASGVRDERVLASVRAVPRADFVPARHADVAYLDQPIPISHNQVTTQPSLSARMIEGLQLTGDDHVLEIGTGYGFQTALLATLAADVVSIERWPDMVERARRHLDQHGIGNTQLLLGDGTLGAPELAPFDAILVSAAHADVPQPLVDQLRVGGRLVQPIGPGGDEVVAAFDRTTHGLHRRDELTPARFVRLYGRHGSSDPTTT